MSILRVSEREESNESVGSYRYSKQGKPKYISSTLLNQCGWNLHKSSAVTTENILEAYNATALIERAFQSGKNKASSHQSADLLPKKRATIKKQLPDRATSECKGTIAATGVNLHSVKVSAIKQAGDLSRQLSVSQFTNSNHSDFSLRFADKKAITSVLRKVQNGCLNPVEISTKSYRRDVVPTNSNPKESIENCSDHVQCINHIQNQRHGINMSEQPKRTLNGLVKDPDNIPCAEQSGGVSREHSCQTNGYNVVKNADSTSLNQALSVSPLSKLIEVDGVNYMVTMESPSGTRRKSSFVGVNLNMPPPNQGISHLSQDFAKSDDDSSDSSKKPDLPHVTNGPQTSGEWEQKRNVQAKHIDLARCETSDVIKTCDGESLNHAALRLRTLIGGLKTGNDITPDVMASNLQYAVSVMEYWFLKNMSGNDGVPSDDDMPSNLSGATPVPPEIKMWLLQTFSSSNPTETVRKKGGDKRSLRSVVHAVQAGMFVERIFRKHSESSQTLPPSVQIHLQDIDKWSFDVFELENISDGNSLKYIFFQLLSKYDLIRKYKIPIKNLMNYSNKLQQGYRKHNNKYHNPIHAADVAQSLNCLLMNSGFQHWLSDLEVFSMIMGAIVHDLEHTGTTNNFHTNTRSELALMYNDRSVLENHHICTAFRLLGEEDCNILVNFSKEDYQECRTLMIDMVLATDMSQHFGQIKRMKSHLQHPETLEKSKAMCLMIHSCDINHPSKPWDLHYRWTERLVVEFFEQGDKERELGLPLSPLCDRHSTMVAQSQIGFIDYVIEPTFGLLFDILRTVNGPFVRDVIKASRKAKNDDPNQRRPALPPDDALKRRFSDVSSYCTALNRNNEIMNKLNEFHQIFLKNIGINRGQWTKKDEIERANMLFGERAFTDPKMVNSDNTIDSDTAMNGIATKKEIEKMNISSEKTLPLSNNNNIENT